MATRKRTYVDFSAVHPVSAGKVGGASLETSGTVNLIQAGSTTFELHNDGANDQIVPAQILDANSVNGWELPLEEGTVANNDGLELTQGILADGDAPYAFTIGTDAAFKLEVQLGIPVVADFDVCAIGFRKAAAYVADIATPAAMLGAYDDKFCINIEDGDYHCQQSLNGSDNEDDVSVTNASNDDTPTISIYVSAAGVATCAVDGTTVSHTAHTFDSGDVVVPFLRLARSGTGADTRPILKTWFCGLQ